MRWLLLLLLASTLGAQDFVGSANIEWPDPERQDRQSADTWGLFTPPTLLSNRHRQHVSYWRAVAKVSAPAYKGTRWGVNCQGDLSYLDLYHSESELPARLIRAGTGASFFWVTGKKAPAMVAGMTRLEMRSDMDAPRIADLKFSQAAFAGFSIDSKWTIMAGLFYTTEFLQTRLKPLSYFPLPFFAANWKPNDELSLSLGLFSVTLEYRPHKLFELRVSHDLPFALNLSITQRPAEWLVFREFFGHHEESYNLTGKRWPDYAKIDLAGWGVGFMVELVPFNGLVEVKTLKGSYVRFTYQFGFAQRWRTFQYDDDDKLALYELKPTHNFALTVSIAL